VLVVGGGTGRRDYQFVSELGTVGVVDRVHKGLKAVLHYFSDPFDVRGRNAAVLRHVLGGQPLNKLGDLRRVQGDGSLTT
jgi:hypothetical protein